MKRGLSPYRKGSSMANFSRMIKIVEVHEVGCSETIHPSRGLHPWFIYVSQSPGRLRNEAPSA